MKLARRNFVRLAAGAAVPAASRSTDANAPSHPDCRIVQRLFTQPGPGARIAPPLSRCGNLV